MNAAIPGRIISRVINLQRNLLRKHLIIIIATPHRVGSTWLFKMVKQLASCQTERIPQATFEKMGIIRLDDPSLYEFLSRKGGYYIYKSHSLPRDISENLIDPKIKYISVLRDPRDVIVSCSFFLAWLDESLGGWGPKFRMLNEHERILTIIRDNESLFLELKGWHRSRLAHKVKYENLWQNTAGELRNITGFLNINVGEYRLKKIALQHSFEKVEERTRGYENKLSVNRKGIIGDWKNYFDKECIYVFKSDHNGRWNKLLVEMGYEASLNW